MTVCGGAEESDLPGHLAGTLWSGLQEGLMGPVSDLRRLTGPVWIGGGARMCHHPPQGSLLLPLVLSRLASVS